MLLNLSSLLTPLVLNESRRRLVRVETETATIYYALPDRAGSKKGAGR